MKTFDELSIEAQVLIKERFARYGMDGEVAYNNPEIFSNEVKNLSSENMIEFLDNKDISHIYPKSQYPDMEGDLNNIFLEDSSINRARGAEIVEPDEINAAWEDQIQDTLDLDVNEDGILDLTNLDEHSSYYSVDNWDLDFSDLIDTLF